MTPSCECVIVTICSYEWGSHPLTPTLVNGKTHHTGGPRHRVPPSLKQLRGSWKDLIDPQETRALLPGWVVSWGQLGVGDGTRPVFIPSAVVLVLGPGSGFFRRLPWMRLDTAA